MVSRIIETVCSLAGIEEVIITRRVANKYKINFDAKKVIDARSAAYYATGIIGETGKTAMLICLNDNESRSCYSGITEAHYKKMPLIFVSVESKPNLEYTSEIKDTVCKTIDLSKETVFLSITDKIVEAVRFAEEAKQPIHIIIGNGNGNVADTKKRDVTAVVKTIHNNNYVFIGSDFDCKCPYVARNVAGSKYGVLSNVLGASLEGKKNKYIGLCDEEEFLLDINTLGNRHINDKVSYCVFCKNSSSYISEYALACGFRVIKGQENIELLNNNGRMVLIIGD